MITQTVSSLLQDSVTLEIDCIDRLYLNAYQPMLQTGGGVSYFFRQHRGAQVASSVLMAPMSADFVKSINRFAREEGLDIERFQKGVRKDEVTQARLADFRKDEGVLYIGVAQEKCSTFRTLKKLKPETGLSYPWLFRSSVMLVRLSAELYAKLTVVRSGFVISSRRPFVS